MKPIGLALWGLHHQHPRWYWPLFARLPHFKPLCLCDADRDFLAREAEFFGLAALADPQAMLARDDVEAVMIFLPHREMPDAVEAAVRAGKHVLVEKPMAATADGARRVCRIAAQTDRAVTTGYCWRYDPMARQIRQWIADGLLGQVCHLQGRMNAAGAWRYVRDNALWMLDADQGGGPMFNLGVHWIDLFHWWTGLEARSVQGLTHRAGGEPERTIEDNAAALIEYQGGAIGLLDISYGVPPSYPQGRDLFVAVRGTKGTVHWAPSWGGGDHQVTLVSEHESAGRQNVRHLREPTPKVPGYCGQMGLDYLADWARAIRRGGPVGIPVTDGLRAVIVAEAVLRSAQGAGRVRIEPADPGD